MAVDAMPLRAGDALTAHGYNLARPVYAWKTANESVTSSTTNQADDELLLPVEPFSAYLTLVCLSVTAATAGDIKVSWSVPTGAQGRRHALGPGSGATGTTDTMRIAVHGWTADTVYGLNSTSTSIIEEGVLFTEAAGGLLWMQWAQNASSGTATVVESNSFMRLQRVL